MYQSFRNYYKNWEDGRCPACFPQVWEDIDKNGCWLCRDSHYVDKEMHRQFYIDRILPIRIRNHKCHMECVKHDKRLASILNRLSNEDIEFLKNEWGYCDDRY